MEASPHTYTEEEELRGSEEENHAAHPAAAWSTLGDFTRRSP